MVNRYTEKRTSHSNSTVEKKLKKITGSVEGLAKEKADSTAGNTKVTTENSLLSNKVKKQDLVRSQVFSTKTTRGPTLMVNNNVERSEAIAGIALLNKHEEAMKRYGGQANNQPRANNSEYYSSKSKPEWNRSLRSPSSGSPYVSLISEPEGYQLI